MGKDNPLKSFGNLASHAFRIGESMLSLYNLRILTYRSVESGFSAFFAKFYVIKQTSYYLMFN